MTRADSIRQKTDEELIDWLYESKNCCYCVHDGMSCNDGMCRDGIKNGWRQKQVSRFESEVWNLLVGILFGMLLQYRFFLDVDFFKGYWLVIMGVLVSWFIIRDIIMGRRKDGKKTHEIRA